MMMRMRLAAAGNWPNPPAARLASTSGNLSSRELAPPTDRRPHTARGRCRRRASLRAWPFSRCGVDARTRSAPAGTRRAETARAFPPPGTTRRTEPRHAARASLSAPLGAGVPRKPGPGPGHAAAPRPRARARGRPQSPTPRDARATVPSTPPMQEKTCVRPARGEHPPEALVEEDARARPNVPRFRPHTGFETGRGGDGSRAEFRPVFRTQRFRQHTHGNRD